VHPSITVVPLSLNTSDISQSVIRLSLLWRLHVSDFPFSSLPHHMWVAVLTAIGCRGGRRRLLDNLPLSLARGIHTSHQVRCKTVNLVLCVLSSDYKLYLEEIPTLSWWEISTHAEI
jgi:hypothetical protein